MLPSTIMGSARLFELYHIMAPIASTVIHRTVQHSTAQHIIPEMVRRAFYVARKSAASTGAQIDLLRRDFMSY